MTRLTVGSLVYWHTPPGPWPTEGIGIIADTEGHGVVTLRDGKILLTTEATALSTCGTELGERRHRRHKQKPWDCHVCREAKAVAA